MPLLDHFHAPLFPRHAWESFHGSFCNGMMRQLNRLLPRPRYYAEFQIHLGRHVEADVAEFDRGEHEEIAVLGNGGGTATAVATYAPPAVSCSVGITFPDDIEVRIIDTRDGARVVAVIELVSPGNKDREEATRAFVAKCAAYAQRGIGVVVVDIVTSRGGNLHDDLMAFLGGPDGSAFPEDTPLYAVAYRPTSSKKRPRSRLDVWREALAVGAPLPRLPLYLRGAGCVPLDLEAAYTHAREDSGL